MSSYQKCLGNKNEIYGVVKRRCCGSFMKKEKKCEKNIRMRIYIYIYSYLEDNLKGTKERGPFLVTDSTVCLFPLTFCTSIESKSTSYICDTLYKSFFKHIFTSIF